MAARFLCHAAVSHELPSCIPPIPSGRGRLRAGDLGSRGSVLYLEVPGRLVHPRKVAVGDEAADTAGAATARNPHACTSVYLQSKGSNVHLLSSCSMPPRRHHLEQYSFHTPTDNTCSQCQCSTKMVLFHTGTDTAPTTIVFFWRRLITPSTICTWLCLGGIRFGEMNCEQK
jgi:hypothetical protein